MICRAVVQRLFRAGWASALLLGFGLAASAMPVAPPSVNIDRPLVRVAVTGSLQRVNAGSVSPWDMQRLDLTGAIAALGTGSLGKYDGTGEMLSFAGRTFIRSTHPRTGVRVVEVATPFHSPFAVTIAPRLVRTARDMPEELERVFPRTYHFNYDEPQLLHTMLEELANTTRGPIAVVGWAHMPEVDGNAMKRAPIRGESLTGSNRHQYLDTIQQRDANVIFVAVVTPAQPISQLNTTLLTRSAFDYHPQMGEPAAALIHVHGALVDESAPVDYITSPLLLEAMETATVRDILHVYGASTVQSGAMLVYQLDFQP